MNLCYTRTYDIWCLNLLHMKMCDVRIHVAHKIMMYRVRTYVTSKTCNVQTYAAPEYEIIFIRTNDIKENV